MLIRYCVNVVKPMCTRYSFRKRFLLLCVALLQTSFFYRFFHLFIALLSPVKTRFKVEQKADSKEIQIISFLSLKSSFENLR